MVEYIIKKYRESDILIQRKIHVFFWSLIAMLVGSLLYLTFQILAKTIYTQDLFFLVFTIFLLLFALVFLLSGKFYFSSMFILVATLIQMSTIVWLGHTLNELKLYNMAFLQSIGIIFSVLVAARAFQIILYGFAAELLSLAFLLFRLLPAAEGNHFPYWSSFSVVILILSLETLIAYLVFYLLNKTLQETKYMAEHDIYTGLPNENKLRVQYRRSVSAGEISQLFFFKIENYTELLLDFGLVDTIKSVQIAAEIISFHNKRKVYRVGSDLLCLYHLNSHCDSNDCMRNTIEAFNVPIRLDNGQVRLLVRGSILRKDSFDRNNSEINLNRGLLALYQAKSEKRNFVIFQEQREKFWIERLQMFHELSVALDENRFSVVYQPVFSKDRKLTSMESLSRWTDEKGKPISPESFIPMLEESGLMNEFFPRMVETVLSDMNKYSVFEGDFPVFINLSPELINYGFDFNSLITMVEKSGIHPSRIGFEITESAMLYKDGKTEEIIDLLRHKGFPLALDDFGTGYSNLTGILSLPFQKIKFDRSFLDGMKRDSKYSELLKILISYLNSCSFTTLIEGVEKEEEFLLLRDFGCCDFQGFLLGRPLPPEDLKL